MPDFQGSSSKLDLSLAFNAIILLIAAVPVIATAGGIIVVSCQMLVIAFGLIAVALSARNIDATQFERATLGILWAFALIPLWIVVQLLPLPPSISHPIWISANEALQRQSLGHLSVDVGESLAALCSILGMIALVSISIVVGRDRRRAELILFAASAITTLLALNRLAQNFLPTRSSTSVDVVRQTSAALVLS